MSGIRTYDEAVPKCFAEPCSVCRGELVRESDRAAIQGTPEKGNRKICTPNKCSFNLQACLNSLFCRTMMPVMYLGLQGWPTARDSG